MLAKIDFTKPKVALDFETYLMGSGPHPTHPKPVVASLFDDVGNNILIHAKDKDFRPTMEMLLEPGSILIGQNIAYDLGVLYYHYPDLITKIYDKYIMTVQTPHTYPIYAN